MRIGYIRADNKMGEVPQRKALTEAGVTTIYVEERRDEILRWIIAKKLRPSQRDTLEVSDLHRLASSTDGMTDAIDGVTERKCVVVEVRSGARSDKPGAFAKALVLSSAFLAGRAPRADFTKLGKALARKNGAPTLHDIEAVMNDHSLPVPARVAKLNSMYGVSISPSTIYRMKRRGKIMFQPTLMGRPSKQI